MKQLTEWCYSDPKEIPLTFNQALYTTSVGNNSYAMTIKQPIPLGYRRDTRNYRPIIGNQLVDPLVNMADLLSETDKLMHNVRLTLLGPKERRIGHLTNAMKNIEKLIIC